MKTNTTNLYQDEQSGGWVLEINGFDGWYVYGWYGTKQAALAKARTVKSKFERTQSSIYLDRLEDGTYRYGG